MNVELLHQEARKLLDQFGLTDWSFKLGSYKRNLGRCYVRLKLISVSEWHATHDTTEQVMETVRHEIAHALVPEEKGHGPEWQQAAIRVGCKDISHKCTDPTLTRPLGQWYAICSCLVRHTWLKRPRKNMTWRCRKCQTELIPVPVKPEDKPKPKGLFD